jgi:hypothetical protein
LLLRIKWIFCLLLFADSLTAVAQTAQAEQPAPVLDLQKIFADTNKAFSLSFCSETVFEAALQQEGKPGAVFFIPAEKEEYKVNGILRLPVSGSINKYVQFKDIRDSVYEAAEQTFVYSGHFVSPAIYIVEHDFYESGDNILVPMNKDTSITISVANQLPKISPSKRFLAATWSQGIGGYFGGFDIIDLKNNYRRLVSFGQGFWAPEDFTWSGTDLLIKAQIVYLDEITEAPPGLPMYYLRIRLM